METKRRGAHSAYGQWLAYMMDVKRVDSGKLAERAGIDQDTLDALIAGQIEPDEAREHVHRLGEILLSPNVGEQLEKVMKALEIHSDLRNWRGSCDGGCCQWNLVTEVANDAALSVQ
jgi:hypothetical protein